MISFRQKVILLHLRVLQSFYKERPVPLPYWIAVRFFVRKLSHSPDPLFPPYEALTSTGASLQEVNLRAMLKDDVLGTWAFDEQSIEFLWKKLSEDCPKTVIECGAGISTLVLAAYADSFDQEQVPSARVFSIEQDMDTKISVEKRLAENQLIDYVEILHAPLDSRGSYTLDITQLQKRMDSRKADWLLIDGPAGATGCRKWTLPLLAPLARSGTRWFLDDAFREAELDILRIWKKSSGIEVKGIHPIGKGLGTGLLSEP